MFDTPMAEKAQNEIEINEVCGDVLEALVKFSYTHEIQFDIKNIDSLLSAAVLLQFTELEAQLIKYYTKDICAANCLGLQAMADQYNSVGLKELTIIYTNENFMDVIECNEFLEINIAQMLELLKRNEIKVSKEEDVFLAAMKWIRYQKDERMKFFASIIEYIRLELIDDSVSKTSNVNQIVMNVNALI